MPYKTHVVLHHPLPTDQSALEHFDTIVVGEAAWPTLKERYYKKTLLYIDIWAHHEYRNGPAWAWQKRPGDIGQKDYVLYFAPGRPTHCYNWTDRKQVERMKWWIDAAMARGVKGVFLDDWFPQRWWTGDEAVMKEIWPGYPSWNYFPPKFDEVIAYLKAKKIPYVLNGSYRRGDDDRMAEDIPNGKENFANLETNPTQPRYVRNGDLLQLNIVDAAGNVSTQNLAVFARTVALAKARGASVGVAYDVSPGGSIYQLIQSGQWRDPWSWPK